MGSNTRDKTHPVNPANIIRAQPTAANENKLTRAVVAKNERNPAEYVVPSEKIHQLRNGANSNTATRDVVTPNNKAHHGIQRMKLGALLILNAVLVCASPATSQMHNLGAKDTFAAARLSAKEIPRSSAFCIRLNFEAQNFSAGWIDVEVEDCSVQLNGKAVVRIFSHPSALGREEFQNVA